jgi:aspartyl-tRNA(Asn)/glutamyl-tRNA(Gln) amidotransferase subunit A
VKCERNFVGWVERSETHRFAASPCRVEAVERVFARDPVEIWTAEFYASIGNRLAPAFEGRRDLIDPAVADILDAALRLELRDYYGKVFERFALREEMRLFFERYDLLLSPVLPVVALDVGKNIPDGFADRNLVSWVYYPYPFNLTGQPAATVCAGFAAGMPVGLQLVGRALGEYDVVRAAAAFERAQPVARWPATP